METRKKKIILIVSLIVLALAGILANRFFAPRTHDLTGKIFDADSRQAIDSGITIKYGDRVFTPGKEGKFVVNAYNPDQNSILELMGGDLYSNLKIDAGVKSYIEIPIQQGAEVFLNGFVRNLRLSLYRADYLDIEDSIKAKVSEKSFLESANDFSLGLTKKGYKTNDVTYAMVEDTSYRSPISGNRFEKVSTVSIIFEVQNNNAREQIKKRTYFVKQQSGWKWLYEESFFERY